MTEGILFLPRVWRDLIGLDFADQPVPLPAKHHRVGVDDPRVFCQDTRSVRAEMEDGTVVTVYLSSGHQGYFGGFDLYKDGEALYESPPLSAFPRVERVVAESGAHYLLWIEWT